MPITLRILSGARAGHTESFEKSVVSVGRHPLSDLRFDAERDLDVSTRHGELRGVEGRYTVVDNNSTNGTFVNGERVPSGASRELHDGDVIAFGAHGPTASVRISADRATPVGARATEAIPTPPLGIAAQSSQSSKPARRPTEERVAIAVAKQTRGLKVVLTIAIVFFAGVAATAYWLGHREAAASDARLQQIVATYEQSSLALQARLQGTGNASVLIDNLQRERDSLVQLARTATGAQSAVMQHALERHESAARAMTELDPSAVSRANNAAIALIRSEFPARPTLEATGFAVAANGRMITNRHVVNANGVRASRVLVKFADSDDWRRAHVVRVSEDATVDLAVLQLDDAPTVPAVSGVASRIDAPVGAPIVSIGFPEGSDLPMDGTRATTSLTVGIVSKIVPDVVQIDSYASHGSSGSPVFDARGKVIGVIYGGEKGSNGRIVYAVPAPKILEILK